MVDALVRAGFVLCGRTNTPAFGVITAAENGRYGISRNPWDTEPHAGRLQRRRRRCGGGGDVPDRPRQRRRRLDPHPRLLLRAGRLQAEPRPRSAPGAELARRGRGGRGGAHGRRLGGGARRDRRPDPLAWYNAPAPARPFAQELGSPPGAAAHRADGAGAAGHPHRRGVHRRRARAAAALLEELGHASRRSRCRRSPKRWCRRSSRSRRAASPTTTASTGRPSSRTSPISARQRRAGRLRVRARRPHAGAAQPPRGGALGAGLRRAAHADLGDPAAAGRRDRSRPSTRRPTSRCWTSSRACRSPPSATSPACPR